MPEESAQEAMVSVDEVAKYLNVHPNWVYRNRKSRNLPHKKVGKHLRFLLSEVRKWEGSG